MFTGIVQGTGKIIDNQNGWLTVTNPWSASSLALGQSICVDGCCLTIVKISTQDIQFQISPETSSTTVLSERKVGDKANLEKSLSLSTLLDGHMVSGHVDSVGQVRSVRSVDMMGCWEFWFDVKPEFQKWLIQKGSVCINGVSLTINALDQNGFLIMCIPHTFNHTNFSSLAVGTRVNLEFDVVAKYMTRMLDLRFPEHSQERLGGL